MSDFFHSDPEAQMQLVFPLTHSVHSTLKPSLCGSRERAVREKNLSASSFRYLMTAQAESS